MIGAGMGAAILIGVVAFVIVSVLSLAATDHSFRRMDAELRTRFPSPPSLPGA